MLRKGGGVSSTAGAGAGTSGNTAGGSSSGSSISTGGGNSTMMMPPTCVPVTGTRRNPNDGEKGSKIQRQRAQSKFRIIVIGLIIFFTLLSVVTVKYRHVSKKYFPKGGGGGSNGEPRRMRSGQKLKDQMERKILPRRKVNDDDDDDDYDDDETGHQVELVDPTAFLPPDSVYRLSMEDIHGQMISLTKYAGMVTLIVNVACL